MDLKNTHSGLERQKRELREIILSKRMALPYQQITKKSHKITSNLFKIPNLSSFKSFLFYLPASNEVRTEKIIKRLLMQHANIYLPCHFKEKGNYSISKFTGFDNLETGPFKIPQPKNSKPVNIGLIEVAIVPGVAFDRSGVRLGYGKGVYDKLLADFRGLKIGLAYDFQIVEKIPKESHDLIVDMVVTDNSIIDNVT